MVVFCLVRNIGIEPVKGLRRSSLSRYDEIDAGEELSITLKTLFGYIAFRLLALFYTYRNFSRSI
jgi:hypothetical protein